MIREGTKDEAKISGLVIESFTALHDEVVGIVRGHYDVKGTLIIDQRQRIKPDENGEFETEVPLMGEKTPIQITEIDDYGKVTQETMTLLGGSASSGDSPRGTFSLGLLYSIISYRESEVPDLDEQALTLKAGASRRFSKKWEASVGAYLTLLPLSQTETTGARFFGANLRLGFTPSLFHYSNTRLTLNGGLFYTTMLVAGNVYGFRNMAGPQIFPVLSHRFENRNQLSTYFKFSPVATAGSAFTPGNREIAAGGAYAWRLRNLKTIAFSIDLADLTLNVPQSGQTIEIRSRSVSAGITYGW